MTPSLSRVHLDENFACWESEHLFGADLYLGVKHDGMLIPLHQFGMSRRPDDFEWRLAHRWVTARMADQHGRAQSIQKDLAESAYRG